MIAEYLEREVERFNIATINKKSSTGAGNPAIKN
jgi:hypothetical protein